MTRVLDGNILDGKTAAAEIRSETAANARAMVAAGARPAQLVAVLVGEDPASQVYVGSKVKGCAEVGMLSRTLRLSAETSEDELLALLDDLNADDAVDGILVQLPLPKQIHEKRVLDRIDPDKDVDGFHPINVGRLWLDEAGLTPATPTGIVALLKRNGIPLAQNRVVQYLALNFPYLGPTATDAQILSYAHSRIAKANAALHKNWRLPDDRLVTHYKNRRWLPMVFSISRASSVVVAIGWLARAATIECAMRRDLRSSP